ncbi:hypothetical protein LAZ67_15001178 [Cordylochernes scorpioides]|uniref:Transposase n=1 Tax=Cordylochernes scorpioides TaxID=51811 RepID=A0ABY6L8L2_9ARAC|nr:hypothetical protein LAZ67_15001178 [Cordylochernes scorpioides]
MKKEVKRKVISLETKIEILDRLRKGDRVVDVAKSYSMNEATIRTIRTNENTIRKSVAAGNTTSMGTTSYTRNIAMEKMEQALMLWKEDQTQKRVPIDTGAITNKALRIYEKIVEQLPSSSSTEKKPIFLASHGCFERFKIRPSLHSLKLKGELVLATLFDEEEEDFDELDDDNFSDDEEYIPHSSDSEQEEDDEQEPHQDSTYFFGRDKMTKWKKEEWRTSRVRTRAINIITHLPCSKQFGKNTPTPLEAFLKFISIDIIKRIVEYTNIFIETIRPNYSRERDCRNTDENEIRCLLGLIIIIGKNRASHLHFKEIWNANGTGIEICRAAMAYERFLFLLRVIRFDNVLTRQIRRDNDKFAALREIFEIYQNMLMADKELSEDDLVNLVCESESDKSDEEELVPVTFTAKVIREGLALGRKLGNHFMQNDTNVERALRFQRDINRCLAQYEEVYKDLTKNSKQLLITDFITISHNVNISASNIESAQITSSDESEFEPSIPKKRMRVISDSDEG